MLLLLSGIYPDQWFIMLSLSVLGGFMASTVGYLSIKMGLAIGNLIFIVFLVAKISSLMVL